MKDKGEILIVLLWLAGVVSLGGLWVLESQASLRPLTVEEQRSIVGGIDWCDDESTTLDGFCCPSPVPGNRSFACGNLCNDCWRYTGCIPCRKHKAWKCADGAADSIVECQVSAEAEDTCETFGGAAVCGFKHERECIWDEMNEVCMGPPDVNPTELPCPRRDCK